MVETFLYKCTDFYCGEGKLGWNESQLGCVYLCRVCLCAHMHVQVVKLASVPAALGLASIRVYAISEEKTEKPLSPEEVHAGIEQS